MTRLLLVLPVAVLVTGCAGAGLTDAQRSERCAAFAAEVRQSGLPAIPDAATAKQVADRLDPLLSGMATPALHDPAVRIHQDLHAVDVAQRQGKADQAGTAAGRVVDAVGDLATACGLPRSAFLAAPSG